MGILTEMPRQLAHASSRGVGLSAAVRGDSVLGLKNRGIGYRLMVTVVPGGIGR